MSNWCMAYFSFPMKVQAVCSGPLSVHEIEFGWKWRHRGRSTVKVWFLHTSRDVCHGRQCRLDAVNRFLFAGRDHEALDAFRDSFYYVLVVNVEVRHGEVIEFFQVGARRTVQARTVDLHVSQVRSLLRKFFELYTCRTAFIDHLSFSLVFEWYNRQCWRIDR